MREKLKAETTAALKAQNKPRLSALRLISAALKERDLGTRGPISEGEIVSLLNTMLKQRREALAIYTKAGRSAQAAQEQLEIAVIEEFLPKPLAEAEVRPLIVSAIAEAGAKSPKEIGKVMALLKGRYAGRMDLARASALVKELLKGQAS